MMPANVRCAGGITVGNHPQTNVIHSDEGCGWKGERFRMGKLTPNQDRELRRFSPEWFRACADADRAVQVTKPCPRCGGRVELIGEGDT